MKRSNRGEVLLETLLLTPLLLAIGFYGMELGLKSFYRAELTRSINAEIERASRACSENPSLGAPSQEILRIAADSLRDDLKSLLPANTPYSLSLILFNSRGNILQQEERSLGLPPPSVPDPKLLFPPLEEQPLLPYSDVPYEVERSGLLFSVSAQAPSLFQRSDVRLEERLFRILRRDERPVS